MQLAVDAFAVWCTYLYIFPQSDAPSCIYFLRMVQLAAYVYYIYTVFCRYMYIFPQCDVASYIFPLCGVASCLYLLYLHSVFQLTEYIYAVWCS